jgi:Kef-type K+ transport system membrane component KefB
VYHPDVSGYARTPTPTEWAVIAAAIGVGGGTLFHLFLGDERNPDRLFIALAGAVILLSGAAAYLELSPLLSGLLLGVILANTSRNRRAIEHVLTTVERPFYFALLILAGALWSPPQAGWLVPILLFLTLRAAGKIGGGRLSARLNGAIPLVGRDWGRGLIGQGGIALAIALDYLTSTTGPIPNLIFTAAVISVLLTDVLAARAVQSAVGVLLRDVHLPGTGDGAEEAI